MDIRFLSSDEAWHAEIQYASVRLQSKEDLYPGQSPKPDRYILHFWDPLAEAGYSRLSMLLSGPEFEALRDALAKYEPGVEMPGSALSIAEQLDVVNEKEARRMNDG